MEEIVFSYTYPRLDAEVTTLEQCTPVYGHVYSFSNDIYRPIIEKQSTVLLVVQMWGSHVSDSLILMPEIVYT